ncbi:hypothetical protein TNCT_670801 [Trichonephila clavata]|uniref:Uncharacterized protein n=1 Tax=Trichonephila clavata TaxID=2740835 RepID=A0A8X6F1A3_TRICU|nr:hypothetical protein TNCT_670801 [Trichonephila clavata]
MISGNGNQCCFVAAKGKKKWSNSSAKDNTPLMPFIFHRLFNRNKGACIGDKFPQRDLSNGLGCHYIPFYGSINALAEGGVDETNSSAVDI